MATMMTFAEACEKQHLYHSYYTVWIVKPDGTRIYLTHTARKSGSGLLALFTGDYDGYREALRKALREAGVNPETCPLVKKTKNALILGDLWKVEFGGTIRQEAAASNSR
jgi:hypothetical protein